MLLGFQQYMMGCNYFWMLCEGIYLHTLIVVAVFAEEQHLQWYFLLGWGFPLVPASIHAVARTNYFDDNCWVSSQTHLLFIVHGPIVAALLVNLFFLLNIVRVLVTKLRDTHRTESNMYMKAVRATLILVPLLGIQFVIIPYKPENRLAGEIYEYIIHILMHYQFLVLRKIMTGLDSVPMLSVEEPEVLLEGDLTIIVLDSGQSVAGDEEQILILSKEEFQEGWIVLLTPDLPEAVQELDQAEEHEHTDKELPSIAAGVCAAEEQEGLGEEVTVPGTCGCNKGTGGLLAASTSWQLHTAPPPYQRKTSMPETAASNFSKLLKELQKAMLRFDKVFCVAKK